MVQRARSASPSREGKQSSYDDDRYGSSSSSSSRRLFDDRDRYNRDDGYAGDRYGRRDDRYGNNDDDYGGSRRARRARSLGRNDSYYDDMMDDDMYGEVESGALPPRRGARPRGRARTGEQIMDRLGRRARSRDLPGASGTGFTDRVRRAFRHLFRESLSNGRARRKNILGMTRTSDGKRVALRRIGLTFSSVKDSAATHGDRTCSYDSFRNCIPNLLQLVEGGAGAAANILVTDRDFNDLVNALDTDGDGKISYGELMSFVSFEKKELRDIVRRLARSIRAQGSDFDKAFQRLTSMNSDGTGGAAGSNKVSVPKLRDMIGHNLLTDLSDEETTTLMQWFDADGDGNVDLNEFKSFLKDYSGNLSRLRLRDDVSAVTDIQMSRNTQEELDLKARGYEVVPGGGLNDGSLGKRLLLWVRKQDLGKTMGLVQPGSAENPNGGANAAGTAGARHKPEAPLLPIVDIRVHGLRRSAALYADGYDCIGKSKDMWGRPGGTSVNAGLLHVGASPMYIWVKRKSPLESVDNNRVHASYGRARSRFGTFRNGRARRRRAAEQAREEQHDLAPILDLRITTGRASNLDSKLYDLPSGGYMRVDCNFNHGACIGRTVYLWYKKAPSSTMGNAQRKQAVARTQTASQISRTEALRAEAAQTNVSLHESFRLQKLMYRVFDRARLAVRAYGLDPRDGSLRNPAQLFEDKARVDAHRHVVGAATTQKYPKRLRFRGFRSAMLRAGVAINDKHMKLLMQQVRFTHTHTHTHSLVSHTHSRTYTYSLTK